MGNTSQNFLGRQNHPELKSNYFISSKRTRSLVMKLAKTPTKLQLYDDLIRRQLVSGFIEKVQWSNKTGCHHVPHFVVENPDSLTTPMRIVIDWATKTTDGVSLNDCLETGEALQNNMLDILLGFRLWKIGIVFDIEKAFHKILLHEDDRDFTRFLWLSDPTDPPLDHPTDPPAHHSPFRADGCKFRSRHGHLDLSCLQCQWSQSKNHILG